MEDTKTTLPAEPQEAIVPVSEFKGYSLEELRYRRALVMLQREFAKEKITTKVRKIGQGKLLPGGSSSKTSGLVKAGTFASTLLTGLNYADYIMIGFSAFGTVRKIVSFFRKKTK